MINQNPPRQDLDIRTEFRCGAIEMLATRWDPATHVVRRTARPAYDAIEFMRAGSYSKRVGARWTLADSNSAAIFPRDEEFETNHPGESPNLGTTIRFHDDSLETLLQEGLGMSRAEVRSSRRAVVRLTTPYCHVLHRSMLQLCRDGAMDSFLFMDLLRAIAATLFLADADRKPPCAGFPHRRAEHARLQKIRELIQFALPDSVRLKDLSADLGLSEAYLCRWFHAHAGLPLHRYVLRIRLRMAIERLATGESMTSLALACGFSSHAHFSSAFRREFGHTPSQLRGAWTGRAVERLRTAVRGGAIEGGV